MKLKMKIYKHVYLWCFTFGFVDSDGTSDDPTIVESFGKLYTNQFNDNNAKKIEDRILKRINKI